MKSQKMKNPWKKLSKVNPQRENGNRQISSEVFNALTGAPLSGGEFRVCFAIIGKTWGFHKTSDIISIRQISDSTGLTDRSVKMILKQLKEKRIICCHQSEVKKNGSFLNEYLFNKYYDTWLVNDTSLVKDQTLVNDTSLVNNDTPVNEKAKENQEDINTCLTGEEPFTSEEPITGEQPITSEGPFTSQVKDRSPGRVSDPSPTKESIKETLKRKILPPYPPGGDTKNRQGEVRKIFNHWNSLGIIIHRELEKFETHIRKKLKSYTFDEITQAMDNYKTILFGDDYVLTFRWSLDKFLSQKNAFDKFLPINNPFDNYRARARESPKYQLSYEEERAKRLKEAMK